MSWRVINCSAGAAPWTPALLTGLSLWLDSADATTITQSGGYIDQWTDKGPTAQPFTQSVAGQKPQYDVVGNRVNGVATVSFTRANVTDIKNGAWTGISGATKAQIFVVWRMRNVLNNQLGIVPLGAAYKNPFAHQNLSNNLNVYSDASGAGTYCWKNASALKDIPFLVETQFDGSQIDNATRMVQRWNGTAQTMNFVGAVGAALPAQTGMWLGAALGLESTTYAWEGDIAEIIICSGSLIPAGERTSLNTYLATKWGLTIA